MGRGRWRAESQPIAAKAARRNRHREGESRGKMSRNLQREPLRRSQSASWNAPKQNAVASMWLVPAESIHPSVEHRYCLQASKVPGDMQVASPPTYLYPGTLKNYRLVRT